MKKLLLGLFIQFSVFGGSDCVDCGNHISGNDGNLVLANLSTSQILSHFQCNSSFNKDFCGLLYSYDTYPDFEKFLKRCGSNMTMDEIYGRAFFQCRDHAYHRQDISVLSHLSIRFGEFGGQMTSIARAYRKQGRLKDFEALLNKQDSQGRTFLDIFADAVEKGERIGASSDKFNQSIIKNACRFGGRYNKRSHPASCKRNDKLFSM